MRKTSDTDPAETDTCSPCKGYKDRLWKQAKGHVHPAFLWSQTFPVSWTRNYLLGANSYSRKIIWVKVSMTALMPQAKNVISVYINVSSSPCIGSVDLIAPDWHKSFYSPDDGNEDCLSHPSSRDSKTAFSDLTSSSNTKECTMFTHLNGIACKLCRFLDQLKILQGSKPWQAALEAQSPAAEQQPALSYPLREILWWDILAFKVASYWQKKQLSFISVTMWSEIYVEKMPFLL